MADGKGVMTTEDFKRADLSFGCSDRPDPRSLPNYGKELAVDDRGGNAPAKCAFCGAGDLDSGAGGFGEGFGYRSCRCAACGGLTLFVYKDEAGRFFGKADRTARQSRAEDL